jgi:aminoglycoside phosphotransferase family enzyme/predicted kinase
MQVPNPPPVAAPALSAASFPHRVERLELVETHMSWVVLTGEYAYKLKKPVRFAFVDATTLAARRRLCELELVLNRRFAPDLYLDVVSLRETAGVLRFSGDGQIVDYAVRMRQFDRRHELAALLAAGEVTPQEIAALAELLADFHAGATRVAPDEPLGEPAQVAALLQQNFDELVALCAPAAQQRLAPLRTAMERQLRDLAPLLARRKAAGCIRDGHGDLHARNIVRWNGRLLPFDCLEFDAALRCGDVALDLAFLYMDLESKQRPDLGAVLLDAYCGRSGDYEALQVLDLYALHRALVRAKVDLLQARGATGAALRDDAGRHLAERLHAAEQLAQPSDPVLVLMHGVSGSGKSWLSEAAIPLLPAIRVRSDVERRRMLDIPPLQPTHSSLQSGAYDAASTRATYARLRDCAEAILRSGRHALVDATFLDAGQRQTFLELAARLGRRLLIAHCQAPVEELRRRVALRAAAGRDASEADAAVLEAQLRAPSNFDAAEQQHVIEIDTSRFESARAAAQELLRALARAPRLSQVA